MINVAKDEIAYDLLGNILEHIRANNITRMSDLIGTIEGERKTHMSNLLKMEVNHG